MTSGWCASTAATPCWCGLREIAARARVHLLNYAKRPVEGLRVRVRGVYAAGALHLPGAADAALADYTTGDGATEFTVPRMETYAVVDLNR